MIRRLLLTCCALGLAACPPPTVDPAPAPAAAVVKSFSASATTVASSGDMVTLTWETENATSVSLEQLEEGPLAIDATAASGSLVVSIERDAVFVLSARGAGGTDSKLASVVVMRGGDVMLFAAIPTTVLASEPVNLVWNAPGAQVVALTEVGGAAIDIGAQRESGSVRLVPERSTSYELTVDGKKATAAVTVRPVIFSFTQQGESPLPGQMLTLSWRTGGAERATLTRAGAAMPLATLTGASVANGTFTDTVPASLPADGVLEYTLELEAGAVKTSQQLLVTLGGAVRIDSFTVPPFARAGAAYVVSWRTTGGTRLELRVAGQLYFTAPDASQIAGGSIVLQSPPASTSVELTVRNAMGSVARQTKQVRPVGTPAFVSFTADTTTLAQGGSPVVLRWNVTNARQVKIFELPGEKEVYSAIGVLDMGTATVYPNKPTVTYELRADNTVGDQVPPRTVSVTVTTPATLTFSKKLPVGLTTDVTGSTVPNGGAIFGLPTVAEDVPGEEFVDISENGTSIAYSGPDTTSKLVTLPEPFTLNVFGRPVSGDKLSININGWFVFSPAAVGSGTATDDNDLGLPSSVLPALSFAPYWDDLYHISADPLSEIYYRIDGSGPSRRLIVQYSEIEHDDFTGSRLTFQAQLYASGKIVYAYDKLDGLGSIDPSIGVVSPSGAGAVVATAAPHVGGTFTFFAPGPLPQPVFIDGQPIIAQVAVGNTVIEVEGNPAILPGQFAITEVNPWPAAGIVRGEWLEITNFSAEPVDLDGWVLDFGGGLEHTLVTPPVLPPNGRLLLSQVPGAGDGLPTDYAYGAGFQLPDGSGAVRLTLAGADYSVAGWTPAQVSAAGTSVRTDPPALNAMYASGFSQVPCASSAGDTYGTHGQRGTPGAPHARCFPYVMSRLPAGGFQSIAAGGNLLTASVTTTGAVFPVNLPRPIRYYGDDVSTIYVGTSGWITTTPITAATTTNRTTLTGAAPIGSIAPFWDLMSSSATAMPVGLFWAQQDPDGMPLSGDEVTVVSWEGWRASSTSTYNLNFQVRFFANGNIEYHYGTMSNTGTATLHQGSSATSWLEDRNSYAALVINISSVSPGIQSDSAYRFTYVP